jgi:predicted dehydrogenase
MKKQIAVGVLGCGYWGPLLVRNFKSLPDCELKAVCDVSAARLKHLSTLYPDVEGTTDPQQFLHDSRLDAVVIATPVKHQ